MLNMSVAKHFGKSYFGTLMEAGQLQKSCTKNFLMAFSFFFFRLSRGGDSSVFIYSLTGEL